VSQWWTEGVRQSASVTSQSDSPGGVEKSQRRELTLLDARLLRLRLVADSEYSARGTFGTPVRHTALPVRGKQHTAHGRHSSVNNFRCAANGTASTRHVAHSAHQSGTRHSSICVNSRHAALPVRGKQHTAHGRHSSVNNFRCAPNGTASTRHVAHSAHQSGTRHSSVCVNSRHSALPVRGKQHAAHGRHSSVNDFRCAANGTASTRKGMTGGRYRWNRRRPDDPHRSASQQAGHRSGKSR